MVMTLGKYMKSSYLQSIKYIYLPVHDGLSYELFLLQWYNDAFLVVVINMVVKNKNELSSG
jgi:hypothetical protein